MRSKCEASAAALVQSRLKELNFEVIPKCSSKYREQGTGVGLVTNRDPSGDTEMRSSEVINGGQGCTVVGTEERPGTRRRISEHLVELVIACMSLVYHVRYCAPQADLGAAELGVALGKWTVELEDLLIFVILMQHTNSFLADGALTRIRCVRSPNSSLKEYRQLYEVCLAARSCFSRQSNTFFHSCIARLGGV